MPKEVVCAELHVIGQIVGATGFTERQLFCHWSLHTGGGWQVVSGQTHGQTHTDTPVFGDAAIWSHPIDIHYNVKSITGWPRLLLQVFSLDQFGRVHLAGYGFCYIPTTPGGATVGAGNNINCAIWRPTGTLLDQWRHLLAGGGTPQLRLPADTVLTAVDRYRLQTVSAGQVQVRLGVILKNFDKFGVEF